ncbi:Gfo/Idh/MocA family oxidoreductase [Radiobacillus kanasensis]|uniref:Gfo/Idh/MocA family protein n=1 Tax=Radiobacillus kanasensis TaxID=2844358 RepID=UPI001E2973D4|nr:Gfo/Idh/MocA family oxidoreductase [Radiobacillus kanasensis]UFU00404.1 Gfo/Idh/MocA family oxidoreductase [Radiobacillus kanasensis]
MNQPRIGIVGLGGIAQKAYLPTLTKETKWKLVGAFSPNKEKRDRICAEYRMTSLDSLEALSQQVDAAFVHSSTSTHHSIVKYLLEQGVDVYVDKPLAATVEEAEELVEISERLNRKLMVGFNRRFAPLYRKAKGLAPDYVWVHMEKHRMNGVGPNDVSFTMLDDYLHLVDTLRWLGQSELQIANHFVQTNEKDQLVFAKHTYQNEHAIFSSAMHRESGSGLEKLEIFGMNQIVRVENLTRLEVERNNQVHVTEPGSWDTLLKVRGFEDSVLHFIDSITNNKKPIVDGQEALRSQQLLHQLVTELVHH